MFLLRDLPKMEVLESLAERYGHLQAHTLDAFIRLLRVASDALVFCEGGIAPHGLTQSRMTVLMLLRREPDRPQSPSTLARKAGVTRPAMTGLIDGLERDGLVERGARTDDRRRVDVRLTSEGMALLDRVLPEHFARLHGILGALTPADCACLRGSLEKIRAGLEASNPGADDEASDREEAPAAEAILLPTEAAPAAEAMPLPSEATR